MKHLLVKCNSFHLLVSNSSSGKSLSLFAQKPIDTAHQQQNDTDQENEGRWNDCDQPLKQRHSHHGWLRSSDRRCSHKHTRRCAIHNCGWGRNIVQNPNPSHHNIQHLTIDITNSLLVTEIFILSYVCMGFETVRWMRLFATMISFDIDINLVFC